MNPKNVDIYPFFKANADKLLDVQWLTEVLRPHCRIKRMKWRGSWLRVIQFPDEFAQWLVLMATRKADSYLEIGTSSGGAFYITDSYLRAAVPGFKRSVGYDIKAKMRNLHEYLAAYPGTEFRQQSSRRMRLHGEMFGAVLVDARHVEAWVLQDFFKVMKNAKLVGFHDIVLEGSTVPQAWAKIKDGRKSWEFINQEAPAAARCGIGAVELIG